jgi:hypothetical protein
MLACPQVTTASRRSLAFIDHVWKEHTMTVQSRKFTFGMPWESAYGYSQALQTGDTL